MVNTLSYQMPPRYYDQGARYPYSDWMGESIPERVYQIAALMSSGVLTPEQLYAMQTAPTLQQRAQDVYSIVDWPNAPSYGAFNPPAEQARSVLETAARWAPGYAGIGERRTVGQQKQMEREVGNLLNWMPTEIDPWAYDTNRRMWEALQPVLGRMLTPEQQPGALLGGGTSAEELKSPSRYGYFPPTMAAPSPTPIYPRRRYG